MEHAARVVIDPLPENLLRHPIDYLQAEHHRLLRVCDLLDNILRRPGEDDSRAGAKIVLDYLRLELPRHIADEEEDLFPRLMTACGADDTVTGMIQVLKEEHAQNAILLESAERALSSLKAKPTLDAPAQSGIVFAETKRRHIRWENALLLPLARARLGAEDLRDLGRGMAARRQIPYPG